MEMKQFTCRVVTVPSGDFRVPSSVRIPFPFQHWQRFGIRISACENIPRKTKHYSNVSTRVGDVYGISLSFSLGKTEETAHNTNTMEKWIHSVTHSARLLEFPLRTEKESRYSGWRYGNVMKKILSIPVFTCVCVCVYVLLHRKGKIVEQYQEGFVIVLSSFFCFLTEIGIHYYRLNYYM